MKINYNVLPIHFLRLKRLVNKLETAVELKRIQQNPFLKDTPYIPNIT